MAEIKVHLHDLVASDEATAGLLRYGRHHRRLRARRRRRAGAAVAAGAVGAVAAVAAFTLPVGPATGPATSP